jgi:hypothetical protein
LLRRPSRNLPACAGSRRSRSLLNLGIPEGNILAWTATSQGVQQVTATTVDAFRSYMASKAAGVKSSKKFFADLSSVKKEDIAKVLTDISAEVEMLHVGQAHDGSMIREFVEAKTKGKLLKGGAFYQLTKTEPKVQDTKLVAIRHKQTGAVYAGPAARQLLGLPSYGPCRLAPAELGEWEVFIQSTSVNRRLEANTFVMYWPSVGKAFKEGASA